MVSNINRISTTALQHVNCTRSDMYTDEYSKQRLYAIKHNICTLNRQLSGKSQEEIIFRCRNELRIISDLFEERNNKTSPRAGFNSLAIYPSDSELIKSLAKLFGDDISGTFVYDQHADHIISDYVSILLGTIKAIHCEYNNSTEIFTIERKLQPLMEKFPRNIFFDKLYLKNNLARVEMQAIASESKYDSVVYNDNDRVAVSLSFNNTDLQEENYSRFNLSKYYLNSKNLSNTDFSYADLSFATLENSDITGAYFTGANCRGTLLDLSFLYDKKFIYNKDIVNSSIRLIDTINSIGNAFDYQNEALAIKTVLMRQFIDWFLYDNQTLAGINDEQRMTILIHLNKIVQRNPIYNSLISFLDL